MFYTKPIPHAEAVKSIQGKTAVTRGIFDRLLPELQAAAFTVSGVECFDALQRIRDAVASVPAGTNWDDAKFTIEQELEPWLDSEAARQRRAELLLRLHGFRAYAATNFRMMEAHKDAFPYRQYIATNDTQVRPTHAALHGKVFPADHPFWENHTGPWEWGCRCEAVALLPEEVEDMMAEDKIKKLPPEAWRVVPPAILDRVKNTGFIDVGPHEQGGIKKKQGVYDIRTPREKTGDPGAFEWRPGEIRMPLKKIKERYDEKTWKDWEKWAKKTKLPDGRSLYGALTTKSTKGTKKAPAPAPAPAPAAAAAPAPAPAPAPAAPAVAAPAAAAAPAPAPAAPAGVPVSNAFPGNLDAALARAGGLIDRVHGDGALRASAVFFGNGSNGWYQPATGDIKVGRDGSSPVAQFIHELGHKLDREGTPGGYISVRGLMPEVLNAIRSTAAFKALGMDAKEFAATHPRVSQAVIREHRRYLEQEVELWARAYMQYIAEATQDSELLGHIAARRAGQTDYWKNTQWEEADFAPVKTAITSFLAGLGWITP